MNKLKWISFKKKKPEQNQKVIYTFMGLDVEVGIYHLYTGDKLQINAHKKGWAYFNIPKMRVPATHWMPLPSPPRNN